MGDIAIVGLAVMGQNLCLNISDKGFTVVAFNRTVSKVEEFMNGDAQGRSIIGASSLEDMVSKLKTPKIVFLMVKAGQPVDDFIQNLIPLLSAGDVIIDGGNTEHNDSIRRYRQLKASGSGILFISSGVSGGEDGARTGPALMPSGSEEAWPKVKNIFQKMAAQYHGEPCCDWVGDEGAGHFVKMVHNGILYADMQIIAEAYHLMKVALGMSCEEMSKVFDEWQKEELSSLMMEITRNIMAYKDTRGETLVEQIRDTAGQKGTGKWVVQSALEMGCPVTLIGTAVMTRHLSQMKAERVAASKVLHGPSSHFTGDKNKFLADLRKAVYASKIITYTQGFMLMRETAKQLNWKLNLSTVPLIWRGGCIIRSAFLTNINTAYLKTPDLACLLLDDFFKEQINRCQSSWREVVSQAVELGIPCPALSSAIAFYDSYRCDRLPANLLQAQRDYFGAHMYEMEDAPGTFLHTNWSGSGGNVVASTYTF